MGTVGSAVGWTWTICILVFPFIAHWAHPHSLDCNALYVSGIRAGVRPRDAEEGGSMKKTRSFGYRPDDEFLGLSAGTLLCAISVAVVPWVGWYLYEAGWKDFGTYLEDPSGCYLYPVATFLYYAAPICLTLRVLFTPAMWQNRRRFGICGLCAPTTLAWAVLYIIPVGISGY